MTTKTTTPKPTLADLETFTYTADTCEGCRRHQPLTTFIFFPVAEGVGVATVCKPCLTRSILKR